MNREKASKKLLKPLIIALVILVAVFAVATPVVAYYIRTTGEVEQEYTPAKPENPSFTLSTGSTPMTDVTIQIPDEGYPVYVRAMIIVTWKRITPCTCENCSDDCSNCTDEEKASCQKCSPDNVDVVFILPDPNSDYSMTTGADWTQEADGFLYYKNFVKSGEATTALITYCAFTSQEPPEDCFLSVEILVQTVQAVGDTDDENKEAWKDAWGDNVTTLW